MSQYYDIYSEAFINGEWICINPILKRTGKYNDDTSDFGICSTYWNTSRSSFGETYNALMELGSMIKIEDVSEDIAKYMKNYFDNQYCEKPICVMLTSVLDKIRSSGDCDYAYFVPINTINKFNRGDIEHIDDYLTPKEFANYPEDVRSGYKWFEWIDNTGWLKHFKEIAAMESAVEKIYKSVNYVYSFDIVRLLVFVS